MTEKVDECSKVIELETLLEESKKESLGLRDKNFELANKVRILERNVKFYAKYKENHESAMESLGFKLLHFENELRKEEREIERHFLEKDQQIKKLENVIVALQTELKSNNICHTCFMKKHNAIVGEHGSSTSQDNFIAKFPLELSYGEHRSPGHDSRNLQMSLPLGNQNDGTRGANPEFCLYHELSPVPEELEHSFVDHAMKMNKLQPMIMEEEDEDLVDDVKKEEECMMNNVIKENDDIRDESNKTTGSYGQTITDCRKTIAEISQGIKSLFDDHKPDSIEDQSDENSFEEPTNCNNLQVCNNFVQDKESINDENGSQDLKKADNQLKGDFVAHITCPEDTPASIQSRTLPADESNYIPDKLGDASKSDEKEVEEDSSAKSSRIENNSDLSKCNEDLINYKINSILNDQDQSVSEGSDYDVIELD
eukprot:gene16010-17626_t